MKCRLTFSDGLQIEGDAVQPPVEGEIFRFKYDRPSSRGPVPTTVITDPVMAVLGEGVFVTYDRETRTSSAYTIQLLDGPNEAIARRLAKA